MRRDTHRASGSPPRRLAATLPRGTGSSGARTVLCVISYHFHGRRHIRVARQLPIFMGNSCVHSGAPARWGPALSCGHTHTGRVRSERGAPARRARAASAVRRRRGRAAHPRRRPGIASRKLFITHACGGGGAVRRTRSLRLAAQQGHGADMGDATRRCGGSWAWRRTRSLRISRMCGAFYRV